MFFIVQINWLETSYLLSEQVLGTCLRMREIAVHQDSVRVCVYVCVCVYVDICAGVCLMMTVLCSKLSCCLLLIQTG